MVYRRYKTSYRKKSTKYPFKRRRFYRKRYKRTYRKKRMNGNFYVNVRQTTIFKPESDIYFKIIAPAFVDFPELVSLAPNFEAYKIMSVRVKVTPQSNVSTTEALSPHYVSAPWHKYVDNVKTLTIENLLTIDKSREYHGNATSTRRFVPAVSTVTYVGTDLEPTQASLSKINWRPRIELTEQTAQKLPHYCGLYAFANHEGVGDSTTYQFTISMNVLMINQKSGLL